MAKLLILNKLHHIFECERLHLIKEILSLSVKRHTSGVVLQELFILGDNILNEIRVDIIFNAQLTSQNHLVLPTKAF